MLQLNQITNERIFNELSASRKLDRTLIADHLTEIAMPHGASVDRTWSAATSGYCGQGIDLLFACKGVGARVDISDLHGGEWVLISWFNSTRPSRDFSTQFCVAVGDNGRVFHRHKATSHPRNWTDLAKMLEGGLLLAARGEAFDEPSAT